MSLVDKGFILWPKRECFLAGPTWEIVSGQDGPIFPTWMANQNAGLWSSCPLPNKAIL